MSKKEKLVARLLAKPRNFTYDEAKTLLSFFDFKESNKGRTSGSRVEFINGDYSIMLHKPHPGNELKPYQIRQLIEYLTVNNFINHGNS